MSADIFKKRIFAVAALATAFFVVLGAYLYSRFLDKAAVHAVSQNYYFLVSDSTHIEASTHQVVLSGGAGYLLEEDGRDYVAISAYLSRAEAESVQNGLDEATVVLPLGREKLYFKTREEKAKAEKIVGAFSCLSDQIELLHKEIARLEKGATQESCKRILEVLKKQFSFLKKEYESLFPAYAKTCGETEGRLQALIDETVYVQDLRYLLCELCVSYVALGEEYSL